MTTLPRRATVFHSRTKSVEWLMTAFMLSWALTLCYPGNTLDNPVYTAFRNAGLDDTNLVIFYSSIGLIRLVTLGRNGHFEKGPMVRLCCCGVGAFTWLFSAVLFLLPTVMEGKHLALNFLFHVTLFCGEVYSAGVASVDRTICRR